MIKASQFVELAKALGFDFWAGVPCSFLTPLINYTITAKGLRYVASANEGDAVAAGTGAALAGHRAVAMLQNSGLGNAVSPLTSLNQVFRIPLLLIVTLRGEPGRADEPQHELMGRITTKLLDAMDIAWTWFPEEKDDVATVLQRAVTHMDGTGKPFALVMKKGSVAPFPLPQSGGEKDRRLIKRTVYPASFEPSDGNRPSRHEVLKKLVAATSVADTVLIASTGYCGRELYAVEDRPNQFYMVGSMGCASSLGLGLSLVLPSKKVIVIDGDGAALMRMGNMATIGAYAGDNFYQLLLDNHAYESTGGQATVSAWIDFPSIAAACGYRSVCDASPGTNIAPFLRQKAPAFMAIETRKGVPGSLPRPSVKPFDVARRLQLHLGAKPVWAVTPS